MLKWIPDLSNFVRTMQRPLVQQESSELLMRSSDSQVRPDSTLTTTVYKVYPARWLILAVCCFLALSSGMQWVSFTTLGPQVQQYYRGNNDFDGYMNTALMTNQIFQIVAFFTGFGGMYLTDTKGIKIACYLGTSLNLTGATIRLIASLPFIESFIVRETLLHIGSLIAAAAQAFFLVLPSKIAECWFPCDQRAIANVLSFVANPAGVALGTLVPSLIFSVDNVAKKDEWTFFYYTFGMEILALLPFVLTLFIRRKLPITPPSASSAAHVESIGFVKSIFTCITNIQFFIQMTLFAFAFSLLWGSMMFIDGPLKLQRYTLQGYPIAVCAVVGTLSSLLAGHIADKTKKFKEIIMVCTIGFAASLITMRLWLDRTYSTTTDSVVIYLLSGSLGAFAIPQFPIGVEMGVETTFPILEATSSGILVIFGSLFMFIVPIIQQTLQSHKLFYADDWKFPLDFTCGLAVIAVILSVFFLRPRYRRLELENKNQSEYSIATDKELQKVQSIPSYEMH